MGTFSTQLKRFDIKTQARIGEVVKKTGLRLLGKVVMRSPVDTGRFRGNWQLELNEIPNGIVETLDKDGGPTISEGESALAGLALGESIYIVNNLPYAQTLENGHSQQAPAGMVAITAAEFSGIVQEAIQSVR